MKRLLLAFIAFSFSLLAAAEETVTEVAPGVFFQKSDNGCNTGWIVFDDYVFVIDANFPQFAEKVVPLIRETTDKPIRFVFDTHHHADHAYGNAVYANEGAIPVSSERCFAVLLGAKDQFKQWAKGQPAYSDMELKLPQITFADQMVYDDGTKRVELLYFGHGHTKGDAVAYLPKEKILFPGDLCVNGAFNYLGEADTESWIRVLTRLQAMDVQTICPGHGDKAAKDLLTTQKNYFVQLRNQVETAVMSGKSLGQTKDAIDIPMYKQWTGVDVPERNVMFVYNDIAGLSAPWSLLNLGLQPGSSPANESPDWKPPKKMLTRGLDAQSLAALSIVAPNMEFINVRNDDEILRHIADVDAMMGPISSALFSKAKKLRWVHSRSAGVKGYGFPKFIESDVVLTNGQALFGESIADHAIGMMLMLAKDLAAQHEEKIKGEWNWARRQKQINMSGKTILILGYGGIGRQVGNRASGFGMRILAIDPNTDNKPFHTEMIAPPSALEDLLPQADVVVSTVPLTRHTLRYFGKKQFDLMKQESYFINVGRGETVRQDELIDALKSGSISGAALDVTDPEPLPKDSPLWGMDNVLITPHMSGRTDESWSNVWLLLRENIRRFANGEALLSEVDKEAGY